MKIIKLLGVVILATLFIAYHKGAHAELSSFSDGTVRAVPVHMFKFDEPTEM